MEIGYARTSTLEQTAGLEAQLRDLKAAGVQKLFSEQLSSVDAKAEGKYKGRAPTARAKSDEALTLLKGGMGATEVARKLE